MRRTMADSGDTVGDKRGFRALASHMWRKLKQIDLNPETAFKRKRPPPSSRRVMINIELPKEAYDKRGRVRRQWMFATNQVITAKYTVYNFVFKNLLEQFRRVANIFFLVLVILQFFPQFTTISPGLAMLPLLIVLFITMVKDGYEDIKRHQSDRTVNRQKTRVLSGHGYTNHNKTEGKSRSLLLIWQFAWRYVMPPWLVEKFSKKRKQQAVSMHDLGAHAPPGSPRPLSPDAAHGRFSSMSFDRPSTIGKSSHDEPRHSLSLSGHGASAYWRSRHWDDVKVGDIVCLRSNDPVPADIVICATSEDDGSCYVETKNLDGEINLKSRYAVQQLTDMRSPEACLDRQFDVEVEPQNTDMYRFSGCVNLYDEFDEEGNPLACPVTLNQVLLRGSALRNTEWVIGVVVMTGADSKIVLNSGDTPSKRSIMEYEMNKMVYVNLGIIGAMAVICAIADAQIEKYYFDRSSYWEYLAVFNDDNPSLNGLVSFANSLITFQNIVPIALYISFEVVRTIQALFIFEDYDMYHEKMSRRTTAKSWNLSDELGQIQYIISDKTGTLTQNLMIFRGCSVFGLVFHGGGRAPEKPLGKLHVKPVMEDVPRFYDDELSHIVCNPSSRSHQQVHEFMRCLSLCHTVHVSKTAEENCITYQAESPDEQALVETAAANGYVFTGRHINEAGLQVPDSDALEKYEVLQVLEFSSARKRMSVILRRHSDERILMYAKGADSMIYSRLAPGQDDMCASTDKSLEEFANRGLRTLCAAMRELDPKQYQAWAREYQHASVTTENRDERMEALADELERDFILLGATAIEDRLQDGVPETIADLKRAGINIWVATGDKLETAIAIGYSTMLIAPDMNLIVVRGGEYGSKHSAYTQLEMAMDRFFGGIDASEMEHPPPPSMVDTFDGQSVMTNTSLVGEENGSRPGGYALVIDGHALSFALNEPHSRELLIRVSKNCRAVICCRVSPLQKALIVRLVKQGLSGITLAIGDGANDVSMIQAAHVGVGVAGEEGLQAVNSADYAIGQFYFLKRLILVHGHWSYYRNSTMVNVFFYKQMVHTGTLFWFQIYCAWSTSQAIDYVYLLLYNAIWTVAAVIGIGIFDRNVSDHVLMQVPELYGVSRKQQYFGMWRFLGYMLDGVFQSVVLFFLLMYFYDTTSTRIDGYDIDLYEPTTNMVLSTVLAANLYAGIESMAWTWWIFGVVWIPTLLLFVFEPIYAAFPPTLIWTHSWGNNYYLYRSAQFWVGGILTAFLSILPRILYEYLRIHFFPTDVDILHYIDARDPNHDYVHDPQMPGLRAAQAYESEVDADASRAPVGDTYPLMPTQSRTSSIYHDMSTGEARPYRGYSFSASDKPVPKPKKVMRRLKQIFKPHGKRKHSDFSYVRSSQTRDDDIVERKEPLHADDATDVDGMKRQSYLDDGGIFTESSGDEQHTRFHTAFSAPPPSDFPYGGYPSLQQEQQGHLPQTPPLFVPVHEPIPSSSEAYYTAMEHNGSRKVYQ